MLAAEAAWALGDLALHEETAVLPIPGGGQLDCKTADDPDCARDQTLQPSRMDLVQTTSKLLNYIHWLRCGMGG